LSVTKTDGVTTYTPGGNTTYMIVVSNAGPSAVVSATFTDTFPTAITNANWTCTGSSGGTCTASGTGDIIDNVNLPVGGSVTYTVVATISASATGSLTNTAAIAPPAGTTDPTPGNNSSTDSDTPNPEADLSVTKSDGATIYTPGGSTTYTIIVSNAGPSAVIGATVVDNFPAAITSASWTCVGSGGGICTASGTGNISDTVDLPANGSVTYTVTANISATATGNLTNTATITPPSGTTDPVPSNNSSTDTDTPNSQANLAITKTDGVTSVNTGSSTTYTIVVSNTGPSDVIGATVTDTFPPAITSVSWTCAGSSGGTCTASGTGDINDSVNIPVGGTLTYTVIANISVSATGSLTNTAIVAPPAGTTDPTPGDNTASDTDTINSPNLTLAKDNGATTITAGGTTTYALTISNSGTGASTGTITIVDVLPTGLSIANGPVALGGANAADWTCTVASNVITCISSTAIAGSSGTSVFNFTVNVDANASGILINRAEVGGGSDPNNPNPPTSTTAGQCTGTNTPKQG
jgi:uncharacterized repeat protein (TIGR01451 family)